MKYILFFINDPLRFPVLLAKRLDLFHLDLWNKFKYWRIVFMVYMANKRGIINNEQYKQLRLELKRIINK